MCDLSISVMCGHKRDREGSLEYDSLAISLVQLINTKSFQMYHIHGYATWIFDPMYERKIDRNFCYLFPGEERCAGMEKWN